MRTDPGCRCIPPLPFLGFRLIRFCTFVSNITAVDASKALEAPQGNARTRACESKSEDLLVPLSQKDQSVHDMKVFM